MDESVPLKHPTVNFKPEAPYDMAEADKRLEESIKLRNGGTPVSLADMAKKQDLAEAEALAMDAQKKAADAEAAAAKVEAARLLKDKTLQLRLAEMTDEQRKAYEESHKVTMLRLKKQTEAEKQKDYMEKHEVHSLDFDDMSAKSAILAEIRSAMTAPIRGMARMMGANHLAPRHQASLYKGIMGDTAYRMKLGFAEHKEATKDSNNELDEQSTRQLDLLFKRNTRDPIERLAKQGREQHEESLKNQLLSVRNLGDLIEVTKSGLKKLLPKQSLTSRAGFAALGTAANAVLNRNTKDNLFADLFDAVVPEKYRGKIDEMMGPIEKFLGVVDASGKDDPEKRKKVTEIISIAGILGPMLGFTPAGIVDFTKNTIGGLAGDGFGGSAIKLLLAGGIGRFLFNMTKGGDKGEGMDAGTALQKTMDDIKGLTSTIVDIMRTLFNALSGFIRFVSLGKYDPGKFTDKNEHVSSEEYFNRRDTARNTKAGVIPDGEPGADSVGNMWKRFSSTVVGMWDRFSQGVLIAYGVGHFLPFHMNRIFFAADKLAFNLLRGALRMFKRKPAAAAAAAVEVAAKPAAAAAAEVGAKAAAETAASTTAKEVVDVGAKAVAAGAETAASTTAKEVVDVGTKAAAETAASTTAKEVVDVGAKPAAAAAVRTGSSWFKAALGSIGEAISLAGTADLISEITADQFEQDYSGGDEESRKKQKADQEAQYRPNNPWNTLFGLKVNPEVADWLQDHMPTKSAPLKDSDNDVKGQTSPRYDSVFGALKTGKFGSSPYGALPTIIKGGDTINNITNNNGGGGGGGIPSIGSATDGFDWIQRQMIGAWQQIPGGK